MPLHGLYPPINLPLFSFPCFVSFLPIHTLSFSFLGPKLLNVQATTPGYAIADKAKLMGLFLAHHPALAPPPQQSRPAGIQKNPT